MGVYRSNGTVDHRETAPGAGSYLAGGMRAAPSQLQRGGEAGGPARRLLRYSASSAGQHGDSGEWGARRGARGGERGSRSLSRGRVSSGPESGGKGVEHSWFGVCAVSCSEQHSAEVFGVGYGVTGWGEPRSLDVRPSRVPLYAVPRPLGWCGRIGRGAHCPLACTWLVACGKAARSLVDRQVAGNYGIWEW